jgi:hypothetical protein
VVNDDDGSTRRDYINSWTFCRNMADSTTTLFGIVPLDEIKPTPTTRHSFLVAATEEGGDPKRTRLVPGIYSSIDAEEDVLLPVYTGVSDVEDDSDADMTHLRKRLKELFEEVVSNGGRNCGGLDEVFSFYESIYKLDAHIALEQCVHS